MAVEQVPQGAAVEAFCQQVCSYRPAPVRCQLVCLRILSQRLNIPNGAFKPNQSHQDGECVYNHGSSGSDLYSCN